MRRLRLDLAYDGADFHGWARQKHTDLRTVQSVVEDTITTVLRLPSRAELVVAGRTDAGVHARGQVAHLDAPDDVDPQFLQRKLRLVLPADISVRRVVVAPPGFDARFSAVWRRYVYRIWDAESSPDPLQRSQVATLRGAMDPEVMTRAGATLVGLHDFAAFCKPRPEATTIRTLLECRAERLRDPAATLAVTVLADAFCHSMVRSLVGALSAVGTGQRDLVWLAGVAASRSRHSQVPVLPAHGLTLEEVGYPDDEALAARAAVARAVRTLDQDADAGRATSHSPSHSPREPLEESS